MGNERTAKVRYEAVIPLNDVGYSSQSLEVSSQSIEELLGKLYFIRDEIEIAIDSLQRHSIREKEESYA